MRNLKVALFAGAALAAAFTSASAADLGPIMQPRQMAPVQVEEMTGGWYLRGDIGASSQQFKTFDHHQTNAAFVWPAYAVTFAVVAANVIWARRSLRQAQASARRRLAARGEPA